MSPIKPLIVRALNNKSFSNMLWLIGDSLSRMGLGFFVVVWLARYMGPEAFGAYNYAFAIVAVYTAVASLGMNGVVVRDLVKGEIPEDLIMGSSFALQVLGSILASLLVIISTWYLRPGESTVMWAVLLMVPSILFRSTDIYKYWFESKISSKYQVVAQNIGFFSGSAVKIIAMLLDAPNWVISGTVSIEALVVALMLYSLYRRHGNSSRWLFDNKIAKVLLSQSWPLVLSGVALILYMRIDQIMIGNMLGDEKVGIYSVSVKLSEVWYFLPTAIVSSLFPKVIRAKQDGDNARYDSIMQFIYDISVLAAVGLAFLIFLVGPLIISIFYGARYVEASDVSIVYAWVGIFYFLSSVSGRWYINENLQMYALTRNAAGLVLGIILNFILIPRMGIMGSAIATLIAYSFAAYFFDAFTKETRSAFIQKSKALWLPGTVVRILRGIRNA